MEAKRAKRTKKAKEAKLCLFLSFLPFLLLITSQRYPQRISGGLYLVYLCKIPAIIKTISKFILLDG